MIQQTDASPGTTRRGAARARWLDMILADLAAFGALALISLLSGLLVNRARHQPLPLVYHSKPERLQVAVARLNADASVTASAAVTEPPREIELDEFQAFSAARKGPVIDARSSYFYGQGHVPGAINLSREGFDADYRRLGDQLSAHKVDAIAIYCSGADCQDSELVAGALRALGYRRLLIYREGWEEWSQSGLPQEK